MAVKISFEGKLGLWVSVSGLAGAGILALHPDWHIVGWLLILGAVAGAIFLLIHHFLELWENRSGAGGGRKLITFIGMIVCGVGFAGFSLAHYWPAPTPTKVVSAPPPMPQPRTAAQTPSTPAPAATGGPVRPPATPEPAKPDLRDRPIADEPPPSVPVPTRGELVVQVNAMSGDLLLLEQSTALQSRNISDSQPPPALTPEQQTYWRFGISNQMTAIYNEQSRIFNRDYRERANTLFKNIRDRTGIADVDLPDICGNHTQYMLASGELSGPYALSKIAQCLQRHLQA